MDKKDKQQNLLCSYSHIVLTLFVLNVGGVCADTLSASAQQNEITVLVLQIEQLRKEGRYSEAIPIAQRLLVIEERALGPKHADVATDLSNLAQLYESQESYAEAEPLYKRSLAIYEKTLGPDHPHVATVLSNLAELYRKNGRYAEAEALLKRSLAIREKVLGPDHPDVAIVLGNLAELYRKNGRNAEAEALLKRSLAIDEKELGPEHADVAIVLGNLAGLYNKQGRYAEAEGLLKRSLAIDEKVLGPEHADVATDLNNLAQLYERQESYAEAEPLYKRSLAIYEKTLGPDHPDFTNALNGLADLYFNEGRYAEAEPLYKRSLAIREKVLGPDHPLVAKLLNNLAVLYDIQGRYAEAEPLYKRSLAIREKVLGPDHPDVAYPLTNLAVLFYGQGRYAEAEALLKRSLAIREKVLGPNDPDVAIVLNNLGGLYNRQGRYAEAEGLLKRSLAIREKVLGPNHTDVSSSLNILADLYVNQSRYAEAEPLYKRSLAIREKVLGPDHPLVATVLSNLAELYRKNGRYAEAEPLYKRSLAIREKVLGPNHPDISNTLNNLAGLYGHSGRYAEALSLIRTTAQRGFVDKKDYLNVLIGAVSTSLVSKSDALHESYQVIQQANSSAASTAISQLSVRFAVGGDQLAQLVRKDQDLALENERLDKSLIESVSRDPSKRVAAEEEKTRSRLRLIATERAEIQSTLVHRFPDFAELLKPQPISVEDSQKLLTDDEVLIVLDFADSSYAWVITRTSAEWIELNISSNQVDQLVNKLRLSLTNKVGAPFNVEASYKLYQSTFGIFRDTIASKKRLSVITNGALSSFPLQVLVAQDPTSKELKNVDWLVRNYAITVWPSVASLKTLRGKATISSATKPMIAFADPVFSKIVRKEATQKVAMRGLASFVRGTQVDIQSLSEYLPQLPGTRDEVQAIAKELQVDSSDIKLGLAATVTAVKNTKLDQYHIVYFATHGLVAGDLEKFAKGKIEPALVFSIPAEPSDFDDGLLTASQIAQLKLDADWVVLSACNTAAEDKPGAEALSGLARAFFYAGARSLIVSHWEVDDRTTANLMTNMFLLMKRNPTLSHGEALQQAILSIIENAGSGSRESRGLAQSEAQEDAAFHPRLWAPFVVVGEPAKPK
jgi:CHAT domain-containing protein/tetratricopeptide (TPR) repeat protein